MGDGERRGLRVGARVRGPGESPLICAAADVIVADDDADVVSGSVLHDSAHVEQALLLPRELPKVVAPVDAHPALPGARRCGHRRDDLVAGAAHERLVRLGLGLG